jgi:hypothetical protein
MNSSSSFCHTIILITALLFCVSAETRACACCSDRGTYRVGPNDPLTGYLLEQINGIEFTSDAQLFLIDGPEPEEQVKGVGSISESYVISAVTEPKLWRLTFRTEDGQSGELILALPSKVATFAVDIHNGETNRAGEPRLYKEWRLEGRATGKGMFKEGFAAPARYSLVFQGRGNRCDNGNDFTHWRLEISGKKAAYAFFGELASARPDHAEQRQLVHDATVAPGPSSTEEEKK